LMWVVLDVLLDRQPHYAASAAGMVRR